MEKALATRADEVIVDLEDAVSDGEKESARASLTELRPSRALVLRINGADSPFMGGDIEVARALPWVKAVVVPKAESPESMVMVARSFNSSVALIALVESAKGISAVDEIARTGVSRLMFGPVDYATDIDVNPNHLALMYPRSRVVVASAAARIAPPVDGPTLMVTDLALLGEEARLARELGFHGKMCIHPSQVDTVNAVFQSSTEELEWARSVIDAVERQGEGVFRLDGMMIDGPVIARARAILGHIGPKGPGVSEPS